MNTRKHGTVVMAILNFKSEQKLHFILGRSPFMVYFSQVVKWLNGFRIILKHFPLDPILLLFCCCCHLEFKIHIKIKIKQGNVKRGVSPCLQIRPCDLDLWAWKSIGFQILLRSKYVPSLVKIHWRRLILECSQGCYTVNIWLLDLLP